MKGYSTVQYTTETGTDTTLHEVDKNKQGLNLYVTKWYYPPPPRFLGINFVFYRIVMNLHVQEPRGHLAYILPTLLLNDKKNNIGTYVCRLLMPDDRIKIYIPRRSCLASDT